MLSDPRKDSVISRECEPDDEDEEQNRRNVAVVVVVTTKEERRARERFFMTSILRTKDSVSLQSSCEKKILFSF